MNSILIITAPAWINKHGCVSFSCSKHEGEIIRPGKKYAIMIVGEVEESMLQGGRVHIMTSQLQQIPIVSESTSPIIEQKETTSPVSVPIPN